MFLGSLPAAMQSILAEQVATWKREDIWIGCSGNLTIERTLYPVIPRLHSNDVTIYSCALGRYFTGKPLGITMKPEALEQFPWLEPYLQTPAGLLASLMLCTRMLQGWGRKNAYYDRMRTGYRDQWPRLFEKTQKKILDADLTLASFHEGDVVDWVAEMPVSCPIMSFPPFYEGGYEIMWGDLEKAFDWEAPPYEVMGADRRAGLFEKMMQHVHWMFGSNYRLEGMDDKLRGIVQETNRNVPILIYGSGGRPRLVKPHQDTAPLLYPKLGPGDRLGDSMAIVVISSQQLNETRALYMNEDIKPADPALSFAVLVDGVLIGCFALAGFAPGSHFDSKIPFPGPTSYMLSDFPVAPSDYPRLSKLVVVAALSVEAQWHMSRVNSRRIRGLETTAFTNNAVSMKYRGILQLLSRKKIEGPKKFQINYGAPVGQWTASEGLQMWKKKWGETDAAN